MSDDYPNRLVAVINAKDAQIEKMRQEHASRISQQDAELEQLRRELEEAREALKHYADKDRWHKSYHRPEVPGPVLPIMYFSIHGWDTEDLEPWGVAASALAKTEARS